MTKKEIIEKLQKDLRVSKNEAIKIFERALKKGEIKLHWNWKKIIDSIVIGLVIASACYCFVKLVLVY